MAEHTTQAAPGELECERARRCLGALLHVVMKEHGPRVARQWAKRAEELTRQPYHLWPREVDGTTGPAAVALAHEMFLGMREGSILPLSECDPQDHLMAAGGLEVEDPDEA